MTPLDAAIAYDRQGRKVLPIPYRSKNPGLAGWPSLRLVEADLPQHFNGQPQNIGVLLGEPSGWEIDVDLDHPCCLELADQYLPHTPSVFGRASRPRSHRTYRVTRPVATRKFKSKSAGMLVELRSTGAQTVFPPSTHESGEAIEWEIEDAEPAMVDPDELMAAIEKLVMAVKVELREKAAPKRSLRPQTPTESEPGHNLANAERVRACVTAMFGMRMHDQRDGSARLFAAACRILEHGLDDQQGLAAIRNYERQRPFPKEWSDDEILQRIRDAEKRVDRGCSIKRQTSKDGKVKVVIDPNEHRVVNETVAALGADDTIYQRGGALVRVIREYAPNGPIRRAAGTASIALLPRAVLRERMTKYIEFISAKRGDEKDRAELLSFYDFPAEHRQHLRTSNPIESTFATARWRGYSPCTSSRRRNSCRWCHALHRCTASPDRSSSSPWRAC